MNIILEGPKASGKTTLAKLLEKEGYSRMHLDANTKNDYDFHLELLEDNQNIVFDRFSIGEVIYSEIYNRKPKMTLSQMESTILAGNNKCIILYSSNYDFLSHRLLNRDMGKKEIDFKALKKSNEHFEFLGYHLKYHENVKVFDVWKYDSAKEIMEVLIEDGWI